MLCSIRFVPSVAEFGLTPNEFSMTARGVTASRGAICLELLARVVGFPFEI